VELNRFDNHPADIAWCPGCGNFLIRKALLGALDELGIDQQNLVMVSGIGQAAKMPQYVKTHFFNGLHGRGLPPATAIKAVNPHLTVIAEGGDGDMYGEGGNHLMHAIRRNPDITVFVHDNMIYGLTKGQASPTTRPGTVTPIQVTGVFEKPVNPMALAIALDASFVARAYAGHADKTREIMKLAIAHKGFALVDIFHSCVSFNKINTAKWFSDNIYYLDAAYDPTDQAASFKKALEETPFPLGVLYINKSKKPFEESLPLYQHDPIPLIDRTVSLNAVRDLILGKAG
jgi:2-oxoglutarate ferredoxin oxidoreductase subunit beta